jgi:hypothetical protein
VVRKARTLQKIKLNGMFLFIYDPVTNDVFDYVAFEDTKRLLPIGTLDKDSGKLRYFTSVIT